VRKKTVFRCLVIAGGAALAVSVLAPMSSPVQDPVPGAPPAASDGVGGLIPELPIRKTLGHLRADLFSPHDSARPTPPRPVVIAPPERELPPPMPYRIAGQVVRDGKTQILLAKGERLFTAEQGQMLEGSYRVESIGPNGVTLMYTPLGAAEHLTLTSAFAAISPSAIPAARAEEEMAAHVGPAQLRWQGPERVFAGSPFEVVLKLTSAQPVRSSPLELSYDAKLLEPVAVKAGGFFAGGKFGYRVAPGGAIFVGPSAGERVASDLDFLVLTFRPMGTGGRAELKLSPLVFEGPDGNAITHEPPTIFRTTIVP
jgi:hypothetical protein